MLFFVMALLVLLALWGYADSANRQFVVDGHLHPWEFIDGRSCYLSALRCEHGRTESAGGRCNVPEDGALYLVQT